MNREAHRIEVLRLQGFPHAEETTRLVRDVASRLLQERLTEFKTLEYREMQKFKNNQKGGTR
jgi:hypothetical protein